MRTLELVSFKASTRNFEAALRRAKDAVDRFKKQKEHIPMSSLTVDWSRSLWRVVDGEREVGSFRELMIYTPVSLMATKDSRRGLLHAVGELTDNGDGTGFIGVAE